MKKHWDIKRTSREKWSAADWHMHRFISNLKSRGYIDEGMHAYLIIYNPIHPAKSMILAERI
jgi:hypothetical protein